MANNLQQFKGLPPPPKGQTGINPNEFSNLPPPPSGAKGYTYDELINMGVTPPLPPAPAPKSGMEKTGNVFGSVFGGNKIGEGIGTLVARNQAKKGKGVVETDYSKLSPEAKAQLQAAGVPTSAEEQRAEIAKTTKGPTASQLVGDTARVALNFLPAGKIAEGANIGLKTIGLGAKIAKPIANIATGVGTGIAFQGANNIAEGDPFKKNLGVGGVLGGAIPAIGPLARGAGFLTKEVLGKTTGEGAGSLGKFVGAIREGGEAGKAATAGLRGNLDQEGLASDASNALDTLMGERNKAYEEKLATLKTKDAVVDHKPIIDDFNKRLDEFGVKFNPDGTPNFNRSPGLARYKTQLEDLSKVLADWGTQEGDNTVVGVDNLKKVIDRFRVGSADSAPFDSFVDKLRKDAKSLVQRSLAKSGDKEGLMAYNTMLGDYEKQTKNIQDAQRLLSLGGKNNADQAFQKLSKVFRGDSEMKKRLLEELNQASGGTLIPKITGTQFSHALPGAMRSTVGGLAAGTAGFSTGAILPILGTLATFSPRVVGETARLLGLGLRGKDMLEKILFGYGANKAITPGDVLINTLTNKKK